MPQPLTEMVALGEIMRLHKAIEDWITGSSDAPTFERDVVGALHDEFRIIEASGSVLTRAELLPPLREGQGSNPHFRITIEDPELLGTWPGLALIGYVERQENATRTRPDSRRRATALLESGVRPLWRHVHETDLS